LFIHSASRMRLIAEKYDYSNPTKLEEYSSCKQAGLSVELASRINNSRCRNCFHLVSAEKGTPISQKSHSIKHLACTSGHAEIPLSFTD
jgi:hypothetical protein